MGDFGNLFKETREAKNITFEQIDADLKIKQRYIEAIEAENFDVFPSLPMARGFLKNYANYLGLDLAEVETLFANSETGNAFKKKQKQYNAPFIELPVGYRRSMFNIDTFITLLIVTALLGSAGFFIYTQYLEPAQAQLTYTPEPVEYTIERPNPVVILPTPTPAPTDTPTPTPTPSPQYYTGVAVELAVHKRSWVQILVDDKKTFEGFLEAGDRPNWVGQKRIAIRAGNGGGIEVFVNGKNMGFMGAEGQVIDQVWEKVDEVPDAPATSTPTPTAQATVSRES